MDVRVIWIFLVVSGAKSEIAKDVPKVSLASTIRVPRFANVDIACEVYGYPYSNITISYTHCNAINDCEEKEVLLSTEQKEINETISYKDFKADYSGVIMCRADNSEGSNQASAEIKFTEDGEDISITSNRLMFSEGTYLDRLLCTVNTYIYEYDLAWFKDGEQVKKIGQFEGVDVDTQYAGYNRYVKKLSWYSNWDVYKLQQPGKYVCRAKHRLDGSIEERVWWVNQTNSADELTVEKATQESIFARSKGEEVEFKVNFYGKSPWKIYWLDKRGNQITWNGTDSSYGSYNDRRDKFIATTEDDWAALKIVNLTSEDAGNYTFYVDDRKKRKQQRFELLIKDVPKLDMEAVHAKPNQTANAKCKVNGYPLSNITIAFTPCENEIKCSEEPTQSFTTVQSEVSQEILLSVESPSEGGTVTCTAENANGLNKTTAEVIFGDFTKEDITIESVKHYYKGGYSDNLVCTASAFKYHKQSLEWFLNGKKIEQSEGVSLSEDGDSRHHSLTVSWSSEKDAFKPFGNYKCQAKRLKNESIEKKLWLVNKTVSDEPITYKSEGESFEFKCTGSETYDNRYRGFKSHEPIIEIRWYKYGRKLEVGNDAGIKLLDNKKTLRIQFVDGENEGKYSCVVIKKSSETHNEKELKIRGGCDGGADLRFLQSLLPDIHSMNASQKWYFKAKVIEALKNTFELKEH